MAKFKNKYRSESHRYRYWDYSAPAAYFVTGMTIEGEHVLGHIKDDKMILSNQGLILQKYFFLLPTWSDNLILDEFIIMPNHFHCIIIITDSDFKYPFDTISEKDEWLVTSSIDYIAELFFRGRAQSKMLFSDYENTNKPSKEQMSQFRIMRRKMIIPKLFGKLKMQASKEINILNNTAGRKNWQDDIFDVIIRNSKEYQRIKNYIKNNPANWSSDRFAN